MQIMIDMDQKILKKAWDKLKLKMTKDKRTNILFLIYLSGPACDYEGKIALRYG